MFSKNEIDDLVSAIVVRKLQLERGAKNKRLEHAWPYYRAEIRRLDLLRTKIEGA